MVSPIMTVLSSVVDDPPSSGGPGNQNPTYPGPEETALMILLPLLIVLSTLLFLLLVFLIFVLVLKRRKGIRLVDEAGPTDLSLGDGIYGEGGFAGVEARWLETVDDETVRGYRRAQDWQLHYPPSSVPSDITLSQFLSIQEKGVSAWSFEPDYESNPSLYVQNRTEITFLADGPGMPVVEGGGNSVMANLPLPKLNEVYYWETKIYEKGEGVTVGIGLATRPYPTFRLPGWNPTSVAYTSDGFKTHNHPSTSVSYGPPLNAGDVLGCGYRPRTGTVFFTKNGRKCEDAFTGLSRFNLFPIVGSTGDAVLHVNLGQAGFVFIEANVKKWGLAPSIGTLAPPPAYGSERGSILLEAGFGNAGTASATTPSNPSPLAGGSYTPSPRRTHRNRRPKVPSASTTPIVPSPLRPDVGTSAGPSLRPPSTLTPESSSDNTENTDRYLSPTHRPSPYASVRGLPVRVNSADSITDDDGSSAGEDTEEDSHSGEERSESESSSPRSLQNPPTPNMLDISLHSLPRNNQAGESSYFGGRAAADGSPQGSRSRTPRRSRTHTPRPDGSAVPARVDQSPPTYSPLDPVRYANGVGLPDLPASMISAAFGDFDASADTTSTVAPADRQTGRRGGGRWGFGG